MKLVASDGNTQYYHGDSRRMDEIADGSVAMIVTSPPYWNAKEYSQWERYGHYLDQMAEHITEWYRVLMDGGRIAVNVPEGYGRPSTGGYLCIGDDWRRLLSQWFELRGTIIWDKSLTHGSTAWGSYASASNPSIRDNYEIIIVAHKGRPDREKDEAKGQRDTIAPEVFVKATRGIWIISPVSGHWHPAPMPPEMARRLIELYTFTGDTVLDPFAGSFTTVAAAASLGRIGVGVEIKEEYVNRAVGPMFAGAGAGAGEGVDDH